MLQCSPHVHMALSVCMHRLQCRGEGGGGGGGGGPQVILKRTDNPRKAGLRIYPRIGSPADNAS